MVSKPQKKTSGIRASITFDPEHYSRIQQVAEEKRVSVAWVVRDAIVKYLQLDKLPSKSRARRQE